MVRTASMMGVYFEDVRVGERLQTLGRTVTESDVMAFAGPSGDFNPPHTDAEFASTQRFGERIAHGLCGLPLLSGLIGRMNIWEQTIVAFLGLRWRFEAPIRFGDTVAAVLEVTGTRETRKGDAGLVTYGIEVLKQHDELVQTGEWDVMLSRGNGIS